MYYYFKPSALRDFKRLGKLSQKRIIKKLDYYTKHHDPLKFSEALKYKEIGSYRYRIGDYRIIFDIDFNKIVILAIGHRRDIYK